MKSKDLPAKSQRSAGKIKTFFPDRAFGFIAVRNGPDIYFSNREVRYGALKLGDLVNFDLRFDAQDRPFAVNIRKSLYGSELSLWDEIPNVQAKKPKELYAEAVVAFQERDYEHARQLFENAIQICERIGVTPNRKLIDSYAVMEKQLREWDKVRGIYQKGLKYFPTDSTFLEGLAVVERESNRLDEAAKVLRDGIRKAPAHKNFHLLLADVLMDLIDHNSDYKLIEEANNHFLTARRETHTNLIARPSFHKLLLLRNERSRLMWNLLKQGGFLPKSCKVLFSHGRPQATDAYTIVQPAKSEFVESYALTEQLFTYCPYSPEVKDDDIKSGINLHKEVIKEAPGVSKDILLSIVSNSEKIRPYLMQLLEDPESYPTIVPVDESLAAKALNEENAQVFLQQLLDEWLSKRDLYRQNFPVSGRRFFGRERELALLNKNIEEGRPTGVFGLRKVGKTSILYQLQLVRKKDLIVYVDPERSTVSDCKYILWDALNEWAQSPGVHLKLKLASQQVESYSDLPEFEGALKMFDEDVRKLMSKISPDIKLVLMIDEIEKIFPSTQDPKGWTGVHTLFRYLRGLAQSTRGRFVPIITGANPGICEESRWAGQENPVFQFFEETFLPLLNRSDCHELVVKLGKSMGVEYEESALNSIYNAAGGHPFFTRLLCSKLISIFPKRPILVTNAEVEVAKEEFLIHHDRLFKEIVDRLKFDFPDELLLLEAIIEGYRLDEIKQLVKSWNDSLRHLEGYQLVERDRTDNRLRIKVELFEKWFKEMR